jgi:hypothetical protein
MLSLVLSEANGAAKHLAADRNRPFAEFTLSEANVLRVTLVGCSNCQALFFNIELCLSNQSKLLQEGR